MSNLVNKMSNNKVVSLFAPALRMLDINTLVFVHYVALFPDQRFSTRGSRSPKEPQRSFIRDRPGIYSYSKNSFQIAKNSEISKIFAAIALQYCRYK